MISNPKIYLLQRHKWENLPIRELESSNFSWFLFFNVKPLKTRSVSQSVQSLSRLQLFATPWITARQASLSITDSQSLLKLMPIELVMPSSHLILSVPFSSCPQPLPASGSFPTSQLFAWGGQSIGVSASASVLPMNTQDLSPSGWTGWISLQTRDSQESSPTPQFKSINFSALSFLHSLTLTFIQVDPNANLLEFILFE